MLLLRCDPKTLKEIPKSTKKKGKIIPMKADGIAAGAETVAAGKAKKNKKIARIVTPILCLCIAAVIVVTQVVLPKQKYDKVEVGDTINFGAYEQDDNISNGKETIEWIVLAKQNNRLFVISRYAIDAQPYNAGQTEATWETCSLRRWLNTVFFDSAFSDREKAMISTVTVSAEKNPEYETVDPGKDTQDKIFLLSISEANTLFNKNILMGCAPTAYAVAQGAYCADNGNTWWWLRSPGYLDMPRAAGGTYDGGVSYIGNALYISSSVRPAMWIDLSD